MASSAYIKASQEIKNVCTLSWFKLVYFMLSYVRAKHIWKVVEILSRLWLCDLNSKKRKNKDNIAFGEQGRAVQDDSSKID